MKTIDRLVENGWRFLNNHESIEFKRSLWLLVKKGQFMRRLYDPQDDKVVKSYIAPFKPSNQLQVFTPITTGLNYN